MSILIVHPEGSAQVVSSSTHWSKGNVDRDLVGFAVLGALLGGFGGGEMAAPLPERALRLIFATWLAGRIFLMRLLSFCVHTAFFLHFFSFFQSFGYSCCMIYLMFASLGWEKEGRIMQPPKDRTNF
jgi:hypothetical protein